MLLARFHTPPLHVPSRQYSVQRQSASRGTNWRTFVMNVLIALLVYWHFLPSSVGFPLLEEGA